MSTQTMNSLVDLFAAPAGVFERISEKSLSVWLPLGILIASVTGIMAWYFLTIDLYQFMETTLTMTGQDPEAAGLDLMMEQASIIRIVSIVQTVVITLIYLLLLALFFFLAAMLIAEEKLSFGKFFAVVAWGSLPSLLSYLSMGVSYALADSYVYIAFLDKTSLASLIGATVETPNFQLLTSITVGSVWSFALFGLAFRVLTRCSVTAAVIVALIPVAIQYGLMLLL